MHGGRGRGHILVRQVIVAVRVSHRLVLAQLFDALGIGLKLVDGASACLAIVLIRLRSRSIASCAFLVFQSSASSSASAAGLQVSSTTSAVLVLRRAFSMTSLYLARFWSSKASAASKSPASASA